MYLLDGQLVAFVQVCCNDLKSLANLKIGHHAHKAQRVKIQNLVMREIHRYYQRKAIDMGLKDPRSGAIAFTQGWGSALNLNIHLPIICADGLWTTVDENLVSAN